MKRDLAKEIYKFYRSGFRKQKNKQQNEVRQKVTDPQSLAFVLDRKSVV
jgi:hypothetical protein